MRSKAGSRGCGQHLSPLVHIIIALKRIGDIEKPVPLPPSPGSYGETSEFMDDLSYTTTIELAEPLARRRVPPRGDLDR